MKTESEIKQLVDELKLCNDPELQVTIDCLQWILGKNEKKYTPGNGKKGRQVFRKDNK